MLPTVIVLMTLFIESEIAEIVLERKLATNISFRLESNATPIGPEPTGMVTVIAYAWLRLGVKVNRMKRKKRLKFLRESLVIRSPPFDGPW